MSSHTSSSTGPLASMASRACWRSRSSSHSEEAKPITGTWSWSILRHLVDGGEDLLLGQVAGGAEEHQRVRRRGVVAHVRGRIGGSDGWGGLAGRVLGQDGVAAELLAEGGDGPHRDPLLVLADEAGVERRADHRAWPRRARWPPARSSDPRPSPAPPAPARRGPGRWSSARTRRSRSQDRTTLPCRQALERALRIDVEARARQQLVALRVRLHEAVLDPVVDHLREVAGAGGAGVHEPALGRQRVEHRLGEGHVLGLAAHHEAVALGAPPHPAARARVDEPDAQLRQPGGPPHAVPPVRVAALDHDVAAARAGTRARRPCAPWDRRRGPSPTRSGGWRGPATHASSVETSRVSLEVSNPTTS